MPQMYQLNQCNDIARKINLSIAANEFDMNQNSKCTSQSGNKTRIIFKRQLNLKINKK